MPRSKSPRTKQTKTRGGLVREVAYLYEDEAEKLERQAELERCSKSEIVRRALRRYFEAEGE